MADAATLVTSTGPEPKSTAVTGAGRRGPSGQELRGKEQQTQLVDVLPPESSNPLHTPAIEVENVHRVYNTIAEHWNHTRYKAWPRVEAFIRSRPAGALVADLGCGNGKNLHAVRETKGFAIASDISAPLAKIAAETTGAATIVADCLCAPFRSGTFDAALSIAVLHHLSTEQRRLQALREAARLLRPNGEFLVCCWSYEQDDDNSRSRHRFAAQDVLVPWSYRKPGAQKSKKQAVNSGNTGQNNGAGAASLDPVAETSPCTRDNALPPGDWAKEPEVYQRYCHVYREGELLGLLLQVPELEVIEHYFDTGNWCAIARRRPN